MFEPRPLLPYVASKPKKPNRVLLTGLAAHLGEFAKPGDAEYEPPPPETRPPEPRIFRNPELATQARVDIESKPEK